MTEARARPRVDAVARRADLRLPQSVDALVRMIRTDDNGLKNALRILEGSLKDVAPTDTPHVDDALMNALGKRASDVSGPLLDHLERIIERLSFPTHVPTWPLSERDSMRVDGQFTRVAFPGSPPSS